MTRLLAALAALLLTTGALGLLAFAWAEREIAAPGPVSSPTVFTVPKGASAREVGRLLERSGLIRDHRLWRLHLWRRGGLEVKAGRFPLEPGMSLRAVADRLAAAPLPEDEPFAVVEGWRLRDTDGALAAQGLITPGDYLAAAKRPEGFSAPFPLPHGSLEGYLYPETYRLPKERVDVHALIQKQLDMFITRVYSPHRAELPLSKRSLHELVTMASMLEREEPVPAQRPLVAGILWKRIDLGLALGVDATSRYPLAEWNDRRAFLARLRDAEDPYNSRLRPGLPPTPIGSVTEASFRAALHPEKSAFLYYLHDSEKKLHPSRNALEHEALRAQYRVY